MTKYFKFRVLTLISLCFYTVTNIFLSHDRLCEKKSKVDNLIDLYQKPSRTLSKSFTQTLLHDPKKRPPYFVNNNSTLLDYSVYNWTDSELRSQSENNISIDWISDICSKGVYFKFG